MPFSVREGINIFLDGFVPTENMRFRTESLTFKVSESATEEEIKRMNHYVYPSMVKTLGKFELTVEKGHNIDISMGGSRAIHVGSEKLYSDLSFSDLTFCYNSVSVKCICHLNKT